MGVAVRARAAQRDRSAFRATASASEPGIWNGRVLLLNRHAVADGVFRGTCFETDYASFLAWRDWNFPDRAVTTSLLRRHCARSDGAYLLGEMAPHTATAGTHLFPLRDARAGRSRRAARSISPATSARELTRKPASTSASSRPGRLDCGRDRRLHRADEAACGALRPPTSCARASCVISRASRSPNSPTSTSCAGRPISIRGCRVSRCAFLNDAWRRQMVGLQRASGHRGPP